MTNNEMEAIVMGFKLLATTIAERIKEHEVRITTLEEKIESLEREPRKSLHQQLRAKGKIL